MSAQSAEVGTGSVPACGGMKQRYKRLSEVGSVSGLAPI